MKKLICLFLTTFFILISALADDFFTCDEALQGRSLSYNEAVARALEQRKHIRTPQFLNPQDEIDRSKD